jgi:hypothetical protein
MNASELHYQPNHLLDTVIEQLNVGNDVELAKALSVKASMIRNIRRRSLPICGFLLIHMSEITGIDVHELRRLMGDRRGRFRIGQKTGALPK